MIRRITGELRHHAPFTIFGAATGIIIMVLFQKVPPSYSYNIFFILHPAHVILSAVVTASMYQLHKYGGLRDKVNLGILLVIGYVGSIGIATVSDSLIPYLGEILLRMPKREMHLGFIEKWWLVNPLALLGVAIAYFRPTTKFPHAGHVLISTWASLFHIIMAVGESMSWHAYVAVFVFLFVSVWIPCCISDIVFPLLFVKESGEGRKQGEGGMTQKSHKESHV
jgi:hypothetical protein